MRNVPEPSQNLPIISDKPIAIQSGTATAMSFRKHPLNPRPIAAQRATVTKSATAVTLESPRRNHYSIMNDLLSLIGSGVTGLTLNIKSEDLASFAENLIEMAKEQLLPVMVSAAQEQLLSKKEVLEKFNVCPTTLWNWSRNGYLVPVKIGRKVSYRQADIERLIIERGKK